MSQREKFEAWFKARWPEFEHPTTSAFEVWQESRRTALEEAANHITRGVDGVKQNGWIDAANERLRCADTIRELAKETSDG
ncbi:hypothetical protein [Paraburkholderia terricola]|uniref:hypothetical protein n=1 Tax=Paraburkholderia terricola TaxID=169427 RepID=UPI003ECD62A8